MVCFSTPGLAGDPHPPFFFFLPPAPSQSTKAHCSCGISQPGGTEMGGSCGVRNSSFY